MSENILRTLTSSTHEKFDGALEILDIITELVSERLGATLCATLYRKSPQDPYRLLTIENNSALATDGLPLLERFVQENFCFETPTGCYLDLFDDSDTRCSHPEFLQKAGLRFMYSYRFEPHAGGNALIVALMKDSETTAVGSAGRICKLASRQMQVVFTFVELELKERALKSFLRGVLQLSGMSFAQISLDEAFAKIKQIASELVGVRKTELIDRDVDKAHWQETLSVILAEQEPMLRPKFAEGSDVALSRTGISASGVFCAALESATEPRRLLCLHPQDPDGFGEQTLELLHLFAHYAFVTLENFSLAHRQKKVNDDLRAAQDRLVRAESLAALGDMASGLAHDFNNMLGAIIGKLEIIQNKYLDPLLQERVSEIMSIANEGSERVRRLQEFAITAKPTHLEPLEIAEIFEEYQKQRRDWSSIADTRRIKVTFYRSTPGGTIEGKEQDIYLLLDKLITNAIEAAPVGGEVRVELTSTGEHAILRISDTGPGIPDSIKNKIFNPFFSTKSSRGAGLGLSVAQGIASRHNARIDADGKKEQLGATFTTSFPIVNAPTPPVPAPLEPQTAKRKKIMVVDDDPQIREVLGDMLTLIDHETETYPDGPSALNAFQSGEYDLIITDLGMPGMSGLEFTAEVKKLKPNTPVAMVTGWGAQLNGAEMREKGIFTILPKPFYLKDIKNLVNEAPQAEH